MKSLPELSFELQNLILTDFEISIKLFKRYSTDKELTEEDEIRLLLRAIFRNLILPLENLIHIILIEKEIADGAEFVGIKFGEEDLVTSDSLSQLEDLITSFEELEQDLGVNVGEELTLGGVVGSNKDGTE